MTSKSTSRPYINPYIGGTLLGVVLFSAFFITGNGLGASGGLTHVITAILELVAPEHVDRTAYFAKFGAGLKSSLEDASVFMLLGTFLGGAVSGFFNKRFKPEIRKGEGVSNYTRLIMAFAGGAIMGYGARLARGCTSGQALSGGAVLSVGSFAFMFSMFGAGYAVAYFFRRFWR